MNVTIHGYQLHGRRVIHSGVFLEMSFEQHSLIAYLTTAVRTFGGWTMIVYLTYVLVRAATTCLRSCLLTNW